MNQLSVVVNQFRKYQAYLERNINVNHDKVVLRQSSRIASYLTWSLILLASSAAAWLVFASTDEVVIATGKLEPIGQVKTVQMPQGGVLSRIFVSEGQHVSKGEILFELDGEATLDKQEGLGLSIEAKQNELKYKTQELHQYLIGNRTEMALARQTLSIEKNIYSRLTKLQESGAIPDLQVLQQLNRTHELTSKIASLQSDRRRQEAQLNQQLESLRSELAGLRSQYSEMRVINRYRVIRAPVSGTVFELRPASSGFVGQGSEPLMKIVPDNALKATVDVDSSKIGFVRSLQNVDLSIDSYPASDFGVLAGRIKSISSDSLAPDKDKPLYRFPVEVHLSNQFLRLKSGEILRLRAGMTVTANIKLRKVTYFQMIISDFKDKAGSLREI